MRRRVFPQGVGDYQMRLLPQSGKGGGLWPLRLSKTMLQVSMSEQRGSLRGQGPPSNQINCRQNLAIARFLKLHFELVQMLGGAQSKSPARDF